MKIVLKGVAASPWWTGQAGDTVDVEEDRALALIDDGHATAAEPGPEASEGPETEPGEA